MGTEEEAIQEAIYQAIQEEAIQQGMQMKFLNCLFVLFIILVDVIDFGKSRYVLVETESHHNDDGEDYWKGPGNGSRPSSAPAPAPPPEPPIIPGAEEPPESATRFFDHQEGLANNG